jgi:hypothetical protein
MQWHDFIFSEKPRHRLLRHSIFWLGWWIYFSVCQYLYQHPPGPGTPRQVLVTVGSYLLLKTFLLVFVYAIACYTFIYFLLPQLLKGKWLKAVANFIALSTFLFIAAHFMFWDVFPFVDSLFGPYKPNRFVTKYWPAVNIGLIDPLKVVAAAGIIKYVKYWWLKQKESEQLEREKIKAELQLLKAQIHPNFLFNALNNIYAYSLAASPRTPELLLKLSDLLSYMLYECDEPLVPLEKEMEMMKKYMALEKTRLNDAIEMELSITGDMTGKMIAPFLLLPFIENAFKHRSSLTEQAWVNIDISVDVHSFGMKLASGVMPESTIAEDDLTNVQKRLNLLYPQKHELKISREPEMLIVLLKIQFAETTVTELVENGKLSLTEPANHQPNLYAAR